MERYPVFMDEKTQYCYDVDFSQIDLQITVQSKPAGFFEDLTNLFYNIYRRPTDLK